MWILSFPVSWLSDYALKKDVSRGTVRKISNTMAHWGPAIALACMSALPTDDYVWSVIVLIIAVALNAGSLCGFQINHIDLSPNFASAMMSVTNCLATITAIVAPLICSLIVSEEEVIMNTFACPERAGQSLNFKIFFMCARVARQVAIFW